MHLTLLAARYYTNYFYLRTTCNFLFCIQMKSQMQQSTKSTKQNARLKINVPKKKQHLNHPFINK